MQALTNPPRISIIIAVKNGAKHLQYAFDSIRNQQYPNLEIIVMDGLSTDNTLDIINANQDIITITKSQQDQSHGDACNQARELVTGDMVTYCNADDWYENNILWDIASAYQQDPSLDVITCGGRIARENAAGQLDDILVFKKPETLALTLSNICEGVSAICCRFFTRRLWDKLGYYEKVTGKDKCHYTTDKELLIRYYLANPKALVISKIGYTYLSHAGSTTFAADKNATPRIYQEHLYWAKHYAEQYRDNGEIYRYMRAWYLKMLVKQVIYSIKNKNFGKVFSKDMLQQIKAFPFGFMQYLLTVWYWLPMSMYGNHKNINR